MKKYLEIFRVNIAEYFVYRLNFVLWRVRVILNLILIYFLWAGIFIGKTQLFSYTQPEMLTYVLMTYVLGDIVFSSRINEIGGEILNGNIMNRLLKPLSIFKYISIREIADKTINVSASLVEITIFILLLQPHIVIQQNILVYPVVIMTIIIGIIISLLISFSIALIAFWSSDIWAPRFIYMILMFTLAGNYFPLDIVPKTFYTFLLLTPFPYFIYLPTRIYLKGLSPDIIVPIALSLVWVVVSFFIAKTLWKKGMKEFSFFGR